MGVTFVAYLPLIIHINTKIGTPKALKQSLQKHQKNEIIKISTIPFVNIKNIIKKTVSEKLMCKWQTVKCKIR